jgi:uncharacterized protein YbjT (DUF2867 family)
VPSGLVARWGPNKGDQDTLPAAGLVLCARPGFDATARQAAQWVQAVGHMLEAARDGVVDRVVVLSCIGAARGHTAPLFRAARGIEAVVVDAGLPYAIVRAGLCHGALVDALPRVAGRVLMPGPGDCPLPFPTPDQVAQQLIGELDRADARNGIVPKLCGDWSPPRDLLGTTSTVQVRVPRGGLASRSRRLRGLRALQPWLSDALAGQFSGPNAPQAAPTP